MIAVMVGRDVVVFGQVAKPMTESANQSLHEN